MGITYENTRVHFDKLVIVYKQYLALYKEFNNGSYEGVTPFDEFYWRMTYYSRYSERRSFGHGGY